MKSILSMDSFREIPAEFTEPTMQGAVFTIIAYILCGTLFFCELMLFLTDDTKTVIVMDANQEKTLRINFDVSAHDLPCNHLSVGVWDSFGSERLNITSNLLKSKIDHQGNFHAYTEEELLNLDKHEFTDEEQAEYDKNWGSASETHSSFDNVIDAHDYTLINFYAGWCGHCRNFAPEWDKVEKRMNNEQGLVKDGDGRPMRMRAIKMNCVDFDEVCSQESILGFPTIRMYRRSLSSKRNFRSYERGPRNAEAVIRWVQEDVAKHKGAGDSHFHSFFKEGCRVEGFVEVARVPGTLHFEAADSSAKTLNYAFTNVSHTVNHLSFSTGGDPAKFPNRIPRGIENFVSRLDGKRFSTAAFHQAPHHYLQVVSTYFEREGVRSYQLTHQHRFAVAPKGQIPQAKFSYSLAPVEVRIVPTGKRWYEFVTSCLAIVGGAFTVIGLLQSSAVSASKAFKQRLNKIV